MNKLGSLVKMAQGDDRSLREYARASGVDSATISRIINGSYIPKNPKVFVSLTSDKAKPRNGVKAEDLIAASNTDREYTDGVKAGMEAAELILATSGGLLLTGIAGIPSSVISGAVGILSKRASRRQTTAEQAKEISGIKTEIEHFVAVAKGILLSRIAEQGTPFKMDGPIYEEQLRNPYDTYIKVGESLDKELILRFIYIRPDWESDEASFSQLVRRTISSLVFLEPNENRTVVIASNSLKAYNHMLGLKSKLSYKGIIKAVHINLDRVEIQAEDLLCQF